MIVVGSTGGLGGMVVRPLRRGDPVLEARSLGTVYTHVAVHPDVTRQRLAVPLRHEPGDLVAVAEDAGAAYVEFVGCVAVGARLGRDPVWQHAGKEEVAGHHDAPGPEPAAAIQTLRNTRPGQ